MAIDLLRFLYDRSLIALQRNTAGFTHEESLIAPPAGNCANWVLGHILQNRIYTLSRLGEQPVWSEADGAGYERGTTTFDVSKARDFGGMLKDLEVSQERLRAGLARLAVEDLAKKDPPDARLTLGETLFFLAYHEGYHTGQIGLLRRMAGKPGAI